MSERDLSWYKTVFNSIIQSDMTDFSNLRDCYDLLLNMRQELGFDDKSVLKYAMKVSKYAHEMADYVAGQTGSGKFNELYYRFLLLEAPYRLDSYCLYIEKNRKPEERFYEPRRKTLKKVVDKIQALEDDELDELFIHMPARVGKAQPLDALVLTPDGFEPMKNIQVGSKVISGNGSICTVTNIFPQGKKDIYRVTFSDGTSAECCKEHLWRVQTHDDRRTSRHHGKQMYRVIKLQEMFGRLRCSDGRHRYSVDYVEPVNFSKKGLLIHPYVMGVLIGDGALSHGKCCITNPEIDIYEKIKEKMSGYAEVHVLRGGKNKCLCYSLTGKNIRHDLRMYGLLGRKSEEKFIPKDYLHSSVEDRLELLQGLCDTDGSVSNGEFIDYSTSSKRLAEDIIYLVRSLGGRATMNIGKSHYTNGDERIECKTRYRLTITLNGKFVPVASKKHLGKYVQNKKVTKKFIDKIEYSRRAECQCIMIDAPSHLYVTNDFIVTHNSQIITSATSWHCSRDPEKSNLYVTYKEGLGGAFLDGVMEIWTDPTYCHNDVFPTKIARTDAKNHKVDLDRKKKYATLSGKGLESGLNGEYDAYGWLILDDILEGIQDVLNPDTLKRKQIVFDNNVMSRKKEQCKLILNGTIWSLHDLYMDRLSFLQNNPEAKKIRYDVLKIPALDPDTDESNFDYAYGVGFSTSYYRTMRAKFEENDDMAGWLAQYQQEPIERDGALFNPEHMCFYNGVLPNEEPLKIVSACDVALGGLDYLSMPVAYVYEDGSVYIHDVIFDNSEKKYTMPKVVNAIIENKVSNAFFEANAGGEGYKDEVERELKEKGYKTNLVSKYAQQMILSNGGHSPKTAQRKEQRIWDNAETIRKFYFREPGCQSQEYRKFMTNVYSFTMTGKNKHEDAPDSLASLAVFLEKGSGVRTAQIIKSPI